MVVSKTTDGGSSPSVPAGFMPKIIKPKLNFEKTTINDLILFCVYTVLRDNQICDFERLIKECFTLFPQAFSFTRYPIWPDARKLDRPLRSLREEGLIKGEPKTEFFITKQGKERAELIAKTLHQGKLL